MSSGRPALGGDVVRLELELGSYELAPAECGELAGLLRRRAVEPQPGEAAAAAHRLESLLAGGRAPAAGATESELDAIADAAWTWLEQVGPAGLPPRVLALLDALRARHAHE